jgi:hypothetical protein
VSEERYEFMSKDENGDWSVLFAALSALRCSVPLSALLEIGIEK